MVNYFIYAKDFSASTHHDTHYHSNGLKTLDDFKKDVGRIKSELENSEKDVETKIIYLHWGIRCEEVNEETTRSTYLDKEGNHGATCPHTIIDWLTENNICGGDHKIKLLYIITDGLIGGRNVEICFEKNEAMHYEVVVFHAFNERPHNIDLSVAASFFKSRCLVYSNYDLHDSTNISEEFDYSSINIDNFAVQKDRMKSYIKLKFLVKNKRNHLALSEVEKLKKLRARLFKELSSTEQSIDLETKDKAVFLKTFVKTEWYRDLFGSEHDIKVDIDKSISTLINYITSDVKSYSFDALKYDTKFRKPVEEEEIIDVDFATEQEIVFPDIILDDNKGIPVVILTKLDLLDKIIFHGKRNQHEIQPASFSKFKSAMECPLFLLNDNDISDSIGYFYTLDVFKQLLAHGPSHLTEPRTRRPFHGGLVLTETDAFDKYNDYVLSSTYFDHKKVDFNVGLFYYVLWKNCEKKEWMDGNVVERFREYAMRRVSGTVCRIGLSSLPLDPPDKTSLLTALWYCVELSSTLFKHDPQNFCHERLRMFYGVSHAMIEILKYFNYDMDLKAIERRRELLSHVMILKKIPKRREKIYYLLAKIFRIVDGFMVSEIVKPQNLYKLNYLKPNHKEMLSDDVVENTVHLKDYVHLLYYVGDPITEEDRADTFDICPKTFRPYFAISKKKSFYTELVDITRQVIIKNDHDVNKVQITFELTDTLQFDRILSLYKLYINCVEDQKKFPTYPEYIEYILLKKKFVEDLVTIFPSNVISGAKDVHSRYEKVTAGVDVYKFIEVCKKYVTRTDRVRAEDRVQFENEEKIREFITDEEQKRFSHAHADSIMRLISVYRDSQHLERRKGKPVKRWSDDIVATDGITWARAARNRDIRTEMEEAFTARAVLIIDY
ncbi:P94 protein [Danaus plexippus plexippus]|uniref:P94 protein n=1 Tax=Danaus plexippus plexippus TaxID=278856 RepID=A0A212FDA6_DANPL|nr:P94 protein [Danaus plexippus plexippus]